jgi:hypothetical protein
MNDLAFFFSTLTAKKNDRLYALEFVKKNPQYPELLFQLAFNNKAERIHIYAAWIWELYILEDLSRLKNYWTKGLKKFSLITHSSMRRAHSKVILNYLNDKERFTQIPKPQKKRLVEILLDWVIIETKTAPLSFSIKSLELLQKEFPEIKNILKTLLIDSKRTFSKGLYPTIRSVFKD